MRASTWTARIVTALIAVIVAPIGLGLLSTGGLQLSFAMMTGSAGMTTGPSLLGVIIQLITGALLLVGIVLSGIWSSAGLIAAGALSFVPLVLAIAPALMMGLYRLPGSTISRHWLDGLLMGIPLMILPVFAGLGLALMGLRRRPGPLSAGGIIAGLIGIPIALLIGGWLTAAGNGILYRLVAQQFRFDTPPLALLGVIGGTLIIVGALAAARWSPYALILPAVVLIVATLLRVFAPAVLFEMLRPFGLDTAGILIRAIEVGVAATVAAMYLGFTVAAAVVRYRSARAVDAAPPGSAPAEWTTAATPPPAYPPAAPQPPYTPAPGQGEQSPWQRP